MVLPAWNSYLLRAKLWSRIELPGPPPHVRVICTQLDCSKTIDFLGLRIISTGNLLHHYKLKHPEISTTEAKARQSAAASLGLLAITPSRNRVFGHRINIQFNDI